MSRKGESITLSLSAKEKEQLEAIALELDCTWGSKPNVSKLMSEIARHNLLVSRSKALVENKVSERGKKAIGLIIRGLSELSLIWFSR